MASIAARAQSMFLSAYATLGERMGAACLEALAAQAQVQLPRFNAQALANMMWAFAKLNYRPEAMLLQSCEAHATRLARTFTPQEMVCCCVLSLKQSFCWKVVYVKV